MKKWSLKQQLGFGLIFQIVTSVALAQSLPLDTQPALTDKQNAFLYCLHADQVRGDVSFVASIASDHPRTEELKEFISSHKSELYKTYERDGTIEVHFFMRDLSLIQGLWSLLFSDIESFSIGCVWPEPAVSTSTLLKLREFDPLVTMDIYGLKSQVQFIGLADGQ